jgi:RHS repeat-associated protein
VDQLFARVGADGTVAWLLTDHLGSVRLVTDGSGVVKDTITYDAYGNITSETDPSWGGLYKWSGRQVDVETGLQYNRARWYDPTTGRWTSQDPLGFKAGDSNLYRYAQNAPLKSTDPSGRSIYVITGANPAKIPFTNIPNPVNKALHQDIAVDTWKMQGGRWVKTGRHYYTFSATGTFYPWFGSNWLGLGTSWTATGVTGVVSDETKNRRVGDGTVSRLLQTTPAEDNAFKAYLDTFVGKEDGYSVARHNCRLYSQWQFDIAKEKYPNRQVIIAN